jgi:predicted nucleic acid-binding protein
MKVVVSNSSPICYLILINQIHLLHEILGSILIPEAVACELGDNAAPKAVQEWIAKPPEWVSIQKAPHFIDAELDRLHAGEREAITPLNFEPLANFHFRTDRLIRNRPNFIPVPNVPKYGWEFVQLVNNNIPVSNIPNRIPIDLPELELTIMGSMCIHNKYTLDCNK